MNIIDLEKLQCEINQFFEDENITIKVWDTPQLNGDWDWFIIETCFSANRAGKEKINEVIKRVEKYLVERGYEVKRKHFSNTSGGPYDGTIIGFKPYEKEDE